MQKPVQRILLHIVAVMSLVALASLATYHIANAHVIYGTWPGNGVSYKYSSTLPSSFYSLTDYAANKWTNISGSSLYFYKHPDSNNYVRYSYIDGSGGTYLAIATSYQNGDTIYRVNITFDSSEFWYTGSGTPGVFQVDGRSIAVHEFGHFLGLDHTQYYNCASPWEWDEPTMCAAYDLGTTYDRTLEYDDERGAKEAYP